MLNKYNTIFLIQIVISGMNFGLNKTKCNV